MLSGTSTTTPSILPSTTSLVQPTFTNEQVEYFQNHYEEGFDLFDPDYYQWLKVCHPDSQIQTDTLNSISLSNPEASKSCSSSSSTSRLDLQTTPSITEQYSHVTPLQPVAIDIHSSCNSTSCLQSPKNNHAPLLTEEVTPLNTAASSSGSHSSSSSLSSASRQRILQSPQNIVDDNDLTKKLVYPPFPHLLHQNQIHQGPTY